MRGVRREDGEHCSFMLIGTAVVSTLHIHSVTWLCLECTAGQNRPKFLFTAARVNFDQTRLFTCRKGGRDVSLQGNQRASNCSVLERHRMSHAEAEGKLLVEENDTYLSECVCLCGGVA